MREVPVTGYVADIEKITEGNKSFHKILFTGRYCQLVVMSLLAGEGITAAEPCLRQPRLSLYGIAFEV